MNSKTQSLTSLNVKTSPFAIALGLFVTLCIAILPNSVSAEEEQKLTILITGANRGLGLEHAKQWTAAGHNVIGTARKPDEATELKTTDAQVLKLDITSDEDIAKLAETLQGKKIDILLNNAGYMNRAAASRESLERCFQVNAAGPLLLAKALIPNLQLSDNPRIINVSSRLGIISRARGAYSAYSISKAALNMATKQLHAQHHRDGIIVISLGPGHNRTDMGGQAAPLSPKESVPKMIKLITSLKKDQSGRFWYHDGMELPW